MAKKTGKRMPLAEVQLEIDGDREYEDMQDGYSAYLEDEADMLQALHDQWDNQWMQDQEDRLQREEEERWDALDRANDDFLFNAWDLHYWQND